MRTLLLLTAFLTLFNFTSASGAQVNASEFSTVADHDHDGEPGLHHRRAAPNWHLKDSTGVTISGEQFSGSCYLLLFSQGTDCVHCAEQLNTFGKQAENFRSANVRLISIHAQSQASLNKAMKVEESKDWESKSAQQRAPGVLILADEEHRVFQQFRAFDPYKQQTLHSTVLVDSMGQIRWQHSGQHPWMNCDFLLAKAKQIAQEQEQDRPKVFLDKNPRIVAYQLGRLNNQRLLLVERRTDDRKFIPVYEAILGRDGMSPKYRDEAVAALVKLKGTNPVVEILTSLAKSKTGTRQQVQTANEIAKRLLQLEPEKLNERKAELLEATQSEHNFSRQAGFAGLLTAGLGEVAWQKAGGDQTLNIACLNSIALVPVPSARNAQYEKVSQLISADAAASIRKAAILAMGHMTIQPESRFRLLAPLVKDDRFRREAVASIAKISSEHRDTKTCLGLVQFLVTLAEKTAAEKRTEDAFLDAMQLSDQLLTRIPAKQRKAFRDRFSRVTVRVVKITTIEDEMRYDVPFFAVEAGRPVQIVLDNIDMMAHNLVVTRPGKMKQVAELGGAAGPSKDYLPSDRSNILYATKMIPSEQRTRLTFKAPAQAGEYPFVCTFPQHWSRMYGVMVVVNDLDEWLKNPTKPKDPIGNTRTFVKSWSRSDFGKNLEQGLLGRNAEIGAKIYKEANCAQCHELSGEGAKIGPELDTVLKRHKGDMQAIVREILEPSYRVDEKYAMHSFLTFEGETITGIIQSETEDEVRLIDNPESKKVITLKKEDIDERVQTSNSIMPKALLDQFTQDEIFELLAYLKSKQNSDK